MPSWTTRESFLVPDAKTLSSPPYKLLRHRVQYSAQDSSRSRGITGPRHFCFLADSFPDFNNIRRRPIPQQSKFLRIETVRLQVPRYHFPVPSGSRIQWQIQHLQLVIRHHGNTSSKILNYGICPCASGCWRCTKKSQAMTDTEDSTPSR